MTALQGYEFQHFLVSSPSPFVAHVQINRPQRLNAFSYEVWVEFAKVFDRLSTDPDVRAVVLSGAGERGFTAGLDVKDAGKSLIEKAATDDAARNATQLKRHIKEFQGCIAAIDRCEKLITVICVVHGVAIGLAIDISSGADIRICTRDTRFSVKEMDIGLAADIGTLARLPKMGQEAKKIVGSMSWVKEVCLSARDFSGEEARAVGFVSQVLPDKAAAVAAGLELAAFLAAKSPVVVQGTKELLNHARDHAVADSLRYTSVWNSAALQSSDFKTSFTSGLKKTTPRFEKL
ncbi:hypothetical protein ACJ41O_010394 [Fusarium nematophilum]